MGRDSKSKGEQEGDYQNWLKYRDSSGFDQGGSCESTGQQADNTGKKVFYQYPEHQKMIEKAEKDHQESLKRKQEGK